MKGAPMCEAPDRDVPALTCGYPLPCPHHNFRRVVRVAVVVVEPRPRRRRRKTTVRNLAMFPVKAFHVRQLCDATAERVPKKT